MLWLCKRQGSFPSELLAAKRKAHSKHHVLPAHNSRAPGRTAAYKPRRSSWTWGAGALSPCEGCSLSCCWQTCPAEIRLLQCLLILNAFPSSPPRRLTGSFLFNFSSCLVFSNPASFVFPKLGTYRHWDRSTDPLSAELCEQGGSWGQGASQGLDVPRGLGANSAASLPTCRNMHRSKAGGLTGSEAWAASRWDGYGLEGDPTGLWGDHRSYWQKQEPDVYQPQTARSWLCN